jgi:vacuolar-type H+-ATPase subunit I/STV1
MNAIPKEVLESQVIETVLSFYKAFLEHGGRQKLAEAVKAQTGLEKEDITSARQRAQAELENITKIINNLLDNLTETNREHVDKRLNELTAKKQQIEARLEELERLSLSQAEIDMIATEGMRFLAGLDFTLRNGLPEEKLTALRRCIERIHINKPAKKAVLAIRLVRVGGLNAIQERSISM